MKRFLLPFLLCTALFSTNLSAQLTTSCLAPTNASASSDSVITLEWDSVPGALGYIVTAGITGFTQTFSLKTLTNNFIIPKVPPCLSFFFSVQAVCGKNNVSPPSVVVNYTTPGCITCDTAQNLMTTNITKNSATFSWDPAPNAVHYVLEARIVGYPKSFKLPLYGNTFTANFLPPGFSFQWRVWVVCAKNYSAIGGPSAWQSFSTPFMKTENENLANSIKLSPNPASNSTSLRFSSIMDQDVNIKIYDLSGKNVLDIPSHLNMGENIITIDLSTLQKGMYFVQYGEFTERLIVK